MKVINRLITKYTDLSEPVKASVWYTLANVLNKGLALIATPIFTRLLSEEEYGTYAVYQSWASILIIFTSLNIFLSSYQKGMLLFKDDREKFTSSQLGLTTVCTIICIIIYLANVDFWTNIFELSPLLMTFMFIELLIIPGLDFWSSRQRFEYKYKSYVLISMLLSVISLVGGVVAVLISKNKVEARVGADILAKVLISGSLFVWIFIKGKCFFKKKYWGYALKFNLPLIPHYLSNYVLNQSDRIMISKMVGKTEAAYYSVSYTISTMMLLVTSAINNALTPYIYRKLDDGDGHMLKKISCELVVICVCLCLITVVFAPEIILIFAGRKYLDAIYIIPPVACSVFFIFLYGLFSNVEYFFQKTGYIAMATGIAAIFNLILNYIFIDLVGYYAAGYTTLFCYILLTFAHFIFYRRVIKIEESVLDDVYDIRFIFMVSGLLMLAMLILTFTYKHIVIRYALVVVIFVFLALKRKKILALIENIKKGK